MKTKVIIEEPVIKLRRGPFPSMSIYSEELSAVHTYVGTKWCFEWDNGRMRETASLTVVFKNANGAALLLEHGCTGDEDVIIWGEPELIWFQYPDEPDKSDDEITEEF